MKSDMRKFEKEVQDNLFIQLIQKALRDVKMERHKKKNILAWLREMQKKDWSVK